jgi:hypothetical protein
MTARSILDAALKLPKKERLRMAKKLEQSAADEDLLIAGAEEAEELIDAYERGEVRGSSADEALRRLRRKLKNQ